MVDPHGEHDGVATGPGRPVLWACRVGSFLQRLTDWALIAAVGGMFVTLFYQVFTRYALNRPIAWGEEVALHLFVWMVFLGAAYGVRRMEHPRLSAVAGLEGRVPALVALQFAVVIFFVVGLIATGAAQAYSNRDIFSPNAGISQFFLYAAVPAGGVLMLVELLMRKLNSAAKRGLQ